MPVHPADPTLDPQERAERVVIDTDVLLSGLRSPSGAARVILLGVREGVIRPVVNVGMILEYEAVLKRPANPLATMLTIAEVDAFLDNWIGLSGRVGRRRRERPDVADPDDAVFADAAVAGLVNALITFNVRGYRLADPRGGNPPFDALSPGDFLRRLTWRPSATSLSAFPRRF